MKTLTKKTKQQNVLIKTLLHEYGSTLVIQKFSWYMIIIWKGKIKKKEKNV
jgi:hypothetical protein